MNRTCVIGEVIIPLVSAAPPTRSLESASRTPHICVCVCTYRRPVLLQRLLRELESQDTDGLFSYSVVVIDNDSLESARKIVEGFSQSSQLRICYDVVSQQSISMARNRAIAHAVGDYVAFIDDDEFPSGRWLLTLFRAIQEYEVDGVLGPVKRYFDELPPKWITKGSFYERATYPTGLVIDWRKGRTGNVLLGRHLFVGEMSPFHPEFRQGEDQEFFYRMIEKGHRFIWCNEAVAYEVVPPIRWSRKFMLRRAILRGAMEPKTPGFGVRSILKSSIALPVYITLLPFAALIGHHRFMTVLVSLCDHLGKLLAVVGVNPIKEQYVTE